MIRFGEIMKSLKQWLIQTKIIRHNMLHVYITFDDKKIIEHGKSINSEDIDFKIKRKLRQEIILLKRLRFFNKICFEKPGFLTYGELSRYSILNLYKESLKEKGKFYTYQGCFLKFTLQGRSFGKGDFYENEEECKAA